jgi:hypothetical protein
VRVDFRRGTETCVAELGLRRLEWFAPIAEQCCVRMTEVVPAKTLTFSEMPTDQQWELITDSKFIRMEAHACNETERTLNGSQLVPAS